MQKPTRVLAYARVSSNAQEERGTSLDAQQEEFARFCSANGYPAPIVYVEVEGGGAEKLEKRLEMARLLRDVREGDLVLCTKQDRWSRHTLFYLQSTERILAAGARFFSIGERFDPSTPEGKWAASIMASTAELEHARIKERTVGNRRRLRAMGNFVEGDVPFGYKADRKARSLVKDPEREHIVHEMFARCVAGESLREISDALREKFPGVGGLDHAAIARKIRSRTMLGEMRPRASKNEPAKPGEQWIKRWPPLVDPSTWRRAQLALERRKMSGRPNSATARNVNFLLRGIVRCGVCGATLAAHDPGPKASVKHGGWYLCRNRTESRREGTPKCTGPIARYREIDERASELAVEHLNRLIHLLASPTKGAPKSDMALTFEARKTRLVRLQKNVVDAIAEGVIARNEAKEKLEDIGQRLDRLERERAVHEQAQADASHAFGPEHLTALRAIAKSWGGMTVEEKREVLRMHLSKATIDGAGKLSLKWKKG
jgi:site-specific DNA recombinase